MIVGQVKANKFSKIAHALSQLLYVIVAEVQMFNVSQGVDI